MASTSETFTLKSGYKIPLQKATQAARTIEAAWKDHQVRHQVSASLALQVRHGFAQTSHEFRGSTRLSTHNFDTNLAEVLLKMQHQRIAPHSNHVPQPRALVTGAENGQNYSGFVVDMSAVSPTGMDPRRLVTATNLLQQLLASSRPQPDSSSSNTLVRLGEESHPLSPEEVVAGIQALFHASCSALVNSARHIQYLEQQLREAQNTSLEVETSRIAELQRELEQLRTQQEEEKQETRVIQQELEALQRELAAAQTRSLEADTSRIAQLEQQLRETEQTHQQKLLEAENRDSSATSRRIANLEQQLREAQKTDSKADTTRIAELEQQLTTAKATSLEADTTRITELERQLSEAQNTSLEADTTRIAELEQQLSEAQNTTAPIRHGPLRSQNLVPFLVGVTATALTVMTVAMTNPAFFETVGVCPSEETGGWGLWN